MIQTLLQRRCRLTKGLLFDFDFESQHSIEVDATARFTSPLRLGNFYVYVLLLDSVGAMDLLSTSFLFQSIEGND